MCYRVVFEEWQAASESWHLVLAGSPLCTREALVLGASRALSPEEGSLPIFSSTSYSSALVSDIFCDNIHG